MQLTSQQQAVVNHNHGPALVFAVAGAGKTTTLEQRIVRLVRERVFAPRRILAAAYNTAVKRELATRLQAHPGCEKVGVMTLHALGLRAVRMAWEAGHLPHLRADAFQQVEKAQDTLLNAVLGEARRLKVDYHRELDSLDRTDFLTWISACKGNLLYPDVAQVSLVLRQSGQVQQAAKPPQADWYLSLFQLMEQVQQALGLLTFDDQLRLGWEVLVTYPTILAQLQKRYDCVLVDEFQDVNLAQYLILDLITARHRNYMVVGDDDQTIYEWRGANPNFILNFAKQYQAQSYLISENFRCPAGPLTLANQVIRHNRNRYPKQLRLTQGLGGTTQVVRSADRKAMGQAIVATIRSLLAQGDQLEQMAVLVRAKAQTPPVELALIHAQIAYEVVGGQPFYARWEVTTLISYCRLALFEQQLQKGKQLSSSEANQLVESWEEVYRHPKRYISQQDARRIGDELARGRAPLTAVLRNVAIADKPWVQERLSELASLLQWLSGAFAGSGRGAESAHALLQKLERRLGYCAYLEQRGMRSESGVDEAENVKQFIEEAKGRGSLRDYLVYLKQLGTLQAAQQAAAGRNLITIRTIHSAKGLEWRVVILPSCDEGNVPHRKSDNTEEERRLLYVALTRSKRDLYIYHLAPKPTRFLVEAKSATVLKAVALLRSALGKPPTRWSLDELRAVAEAVPSLGLLAYLQDWHPWAAGEQQRVVQTVCAFFQRMDAAGVRRKPSLESTISGWRSLLAPGTPGGEVATDNIDIGEIATQGLDAWLVKQMQPMAQSPTPAHKPRARRQWQAFDVVRHPQHGEGIVVSTATTARGRELKVQFVSGAYQHFREDDPALVGG